jgi:hypothetical protein
MKQSEILRKNELFHGSDIMRKYTFKTMDARDSYALFARENHDLAMNFSILGERSALFQEEDCFECLSPHNIAA